MWRFIGFVLLVLGGLAAVFYYFGLTEEAGQRVAARKANELRRVQKPLQVANAAAAPVAAPIMQPGLSRLGSIVITGAETRPKEEQEVSPEINGVVAITKIHFDVGSVVKPGDLLVQLDDRKIKKELRSQEIMATTVSDSKIRQALNAKTVYEKAWERAKQLDRTGGISKADMEMDFARLEQSSSEIVKAESEKEFEGARFEALKLQYELYQLRSRIHGTVVRISRKEGNNVREGEPILTIVNDKHLVAEGAVEAGFTRNLRAGMTVVIEPENEREPRAVLDGHTGPINGLSVAPQGRFLASGSEDGTVILWNVERLVRLPWLKLERDDRRRVGCKCVAISPAVTKDTYTILAGYADGAVFAWSLNINPDGTVKHTVKQLPKEHDQAVNSISFTRDGRFAATGSDDRRVALWDVGAGKRLYWVHADLTDLGNAHHGAVTSVLFLPTGQSLITSGTDNIIRRWKLGAEGSELERQVSGRTGDVTKINLADDGRYLIFDHNDELTLIDSTTLEPKSVMNSRRSGRFVQFAQFSPDGRVAVSATDQGRAMLLRLPKLADRVEVAQAPAPANTPVSTAPAAPAAPETQSTTDLWLQEGAIGAHFSLPEAVKATCAQFLPIGDRLFLLMGSSDNKIRLWELPSHTELTTPVLAQLKFVSPQVESGTGLVRVQAEFENTRKLETGKRVAMLVYPDAADHVQPK
jgi:WD40 repeat protein